MENIEIESNPQELNVQLIDSVLRAPAGTEFPKIASAGDDLIRTHIREAGFLRKLIKPRPITNEELDRELDHDRPVRFVEMERNSRGAVAVPFNVSSNTEFYYGPKGKVEFFNIKTPVFTKSINELRTYRHDLRKLVTEQALNDIQTKEDGLFINLCDLIVGSSVDGGQGVGKSGRRQHFKAGTTAGAFLDNGLSSRATVVDMKKILPSFRLNNGVFLMNTNTANEYEKQDRVELGGDLSGKIWKEGLKAIGDAVISGVPHVFTIKDELVPDGVVYAFTEPNFLGRFYILEDIKLFVKRDEDQIKMHATETIGAGILNVAGVVKFDLNQ